MVAYDDIQAIYKGRERPVWKQLGIEASGRTTVLKVNYRNTTQILAFAQRFAWDVIGAPGTTADDEHPILLPEDAGRQGLVPDVRQCVSIEAEAHCIAEWFLGRKRAGYEWPQMACLYPEHWIGERIAQILSKHEVPIDMAKNNKNRVACSCAVLEHAHRERTRVSLRRHCRVGLARPPRRAGRGVCSIDVCWGYPGDSRGAINVLK